MTKTHQKNKYAHQKQNNVPTRLVSVVEMQKKKTLSEKKLKQEHFGLALNCAAIFCKVQSALRKFLKASSSLG